MSDQWQTLLRLRDFLSTKIKGDGGLFGNHYLRTAVVNRDLVRGNKQSRRHSVNKPKFPPEEKRRSSERAPLHHAKGELRAVKDDNCPFSHYGVPLL